MNTDSFSGDGSLDSEEMLRRAGVLAEAGADMIDVGAESARTNREAIGAEEEIERFRGFLERWGENVAGLPGER